MKVEYLNRVCLKRLKYASHLPLHILWREVLIVAFEWIYFGIDGKFLPPIHILGQ